MRLYCTWYIMHVVDCTQGGWKNCLSFLPKLHHLCKLWERERVLVSYINFLGSEAISLHKNGRVKSDWSLLINYIMSTRSEKQPSYVDLKVPRLGLSPWADNLASSNVGIYKAWLSWANLKPRRTFHWRWKCLRLPTYCFRQVALLCHSPSHLD